MRPYKVEHLSDSLDDGPEDIFELVGILVHSGTAESGHYYSFIRERPSDCEKENWVEFNDDCVNPWDPSCMEGACFGGVDYRGTLDSSNIQYDKPYSAYMLFYQRSSVLALQKQDMDVKGLRSPVRVDIPPQVSTQIGMENELLMRKYCLYDRSHVHFVTKMLGNIRNINQGVCSQEHTLEKSALITALNHLDQVITRTKDLPDLSAFMLIVEQLCYSCAECSRDFLEWFCDCPEVLRNQLFRNPDAPVRSRIARLILTALNKVRADASYAYGLGDDESSDDGVEDSENPPRVIQRVAEALTKLWEVFDRHTRAWPEYFGLLASIADMGDHEAVLLLDMGFLRKVLEVISADPILPMSAQYTRMLAIINKRITSRPVSFDNAIDLLNKLLQVCDSAADTIPDNDERLESSMNGALVPLTHPERHLLMQHWTRGHAHILVEKLLQINQNPQATQNLLIMLLHWPETLDHYIHRAIVHGIRKGTSSVPSGSFFQAALLYCEHSEDPDGLATVVSHISLTASQIDNTEGREFLQFFKNIFNLQTTYRDISRDQIQIFCLGKIPQWAPALLCYYETLVRQETEEFLHDILLRFRPDSDFEIPELNPARTKALMSAAQKLGIGCLEHLQETYIRQRQQAVRSNLINIQSVIDACGHFFDEESKNNITHHFFSLRSSTLFV